MALTFESGEGAASSPLVCGGDVAQYLQSGIPDLRVVEFAGMNLPLRRCQESPHCTREVSASDISSGQDLDSSCVTSNGGRAIVGSRFFEPPGQPQDLRLVFDLGRVRQEHKVDDDGGRSAQRHELVLEAGVW